MIAALVKKDLMLFFRNQFFAVITVLVLIAFIALYFLLPAETEDTLKLALYLEGSAGSEEAEFWAEGLEAEVFDSKETLVAAVEEGEYPAGVVLTREALSAAARGEEGTIPIYYAPGTPRDLRESYDDVLTVGMNHHLLGTSSPINVSEQSEVLGPDLLGEPLSPRQRMLPILILMIFMVEMMGLATITVEEIHGKTADALLITPLGVRDFLTAKGIMGAGLALVQVLLLTVVTGALFESPAAVLITLFFGGVMLSGLAFCLAAVGRDMMSVISWSTLVYLTFTIPALAIVFPGLAGDWVDLIPSQYIVDTLHRAMNFGAGVSDLAASLVTLGAISLFTLLLGTTALRRRLS